MIQTGDIFNHNDLFSSVDELVGIDWKNTLKTPLFLSFIDDQFYDLTQIGPIGYSDIMMHGWDKESSAHDLDKQLKKSGYRTTFSFAYRYNLPKTMRYRIVTDTAKLDWFYQVWSHPNLTQKECEKMAVNFKNANSISYYYAQFVWANNQNAQFDYKTKLQPFRDWEKILHFLYGTSFEFHPKDVYTHLFEFDTKGPAYDKQKRFKELCEHYGIDTGCLVLSDEHMNKLDKILKKQDTPYLIQLFQKYFQNIKQ